MKINAEKNTIFLVGDWRITFGRLINWNSLINLNSIFPMNSHDTAELHGIFND